MSLVTTTLFGQLTILPIPSQVPVGERLSWKTDIIPSRDGSEEAHQVRNLARRRYDYKLPANQDEYQRAFNTLYGARTNQWAVPMWTEAQQIGAVTGGQTSLTATTDSYDFRADSLALLWASPRDWQVVEIQTVNTGPDSLDLYGTTNAFSNAWLMPVRIGHIIGNINRDSNSHASEYTVGFDLEDLVEISSSAPAQYLFNDIYFDEWLFSGGKISDRLIQQVDYVDEELGVVAYRSPWTNGRVSRPMAKILETPAEVYAFRQFLYRRAGRYRKFWQPSFDSDLRVTSTGTVTDVLRISADDWDDHSDNRTHIAIEDSDGNWYARNIDSYAVASGTDLNLTLDSAINVAASSIVRVSYLGLKRLETDIVDFDWLGGGACQVQIRMLELSP